MRKEAASNGFNVYIFSVTFKLKYLENTNPSLKMRKHESSPAASKYQL